MSMRSTLEIAFAAIALVATPAAAMLHAEGQAPAAASAHPECRKAPCPEAGTDRAGPMRTHAVRAFSLQ